MVHIIIHFLALISYFAVPLTADDEACSPSFVRSISASDDYILSWIPASDGCPVSYYLITILSRDAETVHKSEYFFMDVSFLPTCELATFTITPVSTGNIQGSVRSKDIQMPVRADTNLTIDHINITQQSERSFMLSWELEEEWQLCTNRFRVVVYNEDYDNAVDVYVEDTTTLLEGINPCEDYTFTVRAIHNLLNEGPIYLIRYSTPGARIDPPGLNSIHLGATSVGLDWQLESFIQNRCAVSSIVIDGSPYFSVTYPVRDEPHRPILSTNVTGLEADTLYFLNVTVINVAGPSLPLLIAVQTLGNS